MGGEETNCRSLGKTNASMLGVIWKMFLFIFILNAPLPKGPKLGEHGLIAEEKDPTTLRLSPGKYQGWPLRELSKKAVKNRVNIG